jgi:hypothetical protein
MTQPTNKCPWGWTKSLGWYYYLENSTKLVHSTHPPDACVDRYCCLHNPSDHPYREWEQVWGHPGTGAAVMYRLSPDEKQVIIDPDDGNFNRGPKHPQPAGTAWRVANPQRQSRAGHP